MPTPATPSDEASAGNRKTAARSLTAISRFSNDTVSKLGESVTMATLHLPTRRLILAGGFAVAIAAAPAVAMFAVPTTGTTAPSVSACAGGETEDQFTNICVPDVVPNSPDFSSTAPVGGLPEIGAIQCTGNNPGEWIGVGEEENAAGPIAVPHSSVSSSP